MKNYRDLSKISLLIAGAIFVLTGCGGMDVSIPTDYNFDCSKYLKLGNYKGLSSDVTAAKVSDGDVESYINSVLEQSKTSTEVKKGTVTTESTVDIDYVGRIDGKKFEGGSGSTTLDIDNSNFIDGFAEGIVGHKVGETFDINVTFPENYASDDVAGKDAVFTVTVKSMQEEVIPEYNDQFVQDNTDFNNTEEYEADIRKNLQTEKEQEADKNKKLDLFNQIADNSEMTSMPEKEYKSRYKLVIDRYTSAAESNDMSLNDYMTSNYGISEKEFKKNAKKSAKNTVKEELIIHSIADKEGIKISKSEYEKYLKKLIKDAGYTEDTFKSENGLSIEEYAEANNLYTLCLYNKVMDKVIEYSK